MTDTLTHNGTPWTVERNREGAWAYAPSRGSVFLSASGLELFHVRTVPLSVLEALWVIWGARNQRGAQSVTTHALKRELAERNR